MGRHKTKNAVLLEPTENSEANINSEFPGEDSEKTPSNYAVDPKSNKIEFVGYVDAMTECMKKYFGYKGLTVLNWSAPFLIKQDETGRRRLCVSDYFPEAKLAIDRFYTKQDMTAGECDLKRRLCNENGVKYVALCAEKKNDFQTEVLKADLQEVKK